jgi:hypothetical protein
VFAGCGVAGSRFAAGVAAGGVSTVTLVTGELFDAGGLSDLQLHQSHSLQHPLPASTAANTPTASP